MGGAEEEQVTETSSRLPSEPRTLRSLTEPKPRVDHPNNGATQAPLKYYFGTKILLDSSVDTHEHTFKETMY